MWPRFVIKQTGIFIEIEDKKELLFFLSSPEVDELMPFDFNLCYLC